MYKVPKMHIKLQRNKYYKLIILKKSKVWSILKSQVIFEFYFCLMLVNRGVSYIDITNIHV